MHRLLLQSRLPSSERLKPAIIRTSQGNIHNLPQLREVINIGITA